MDGQLVSDGVWPYPECVDYSCDSYHAGDPRCRLVEAAVGNNPWGPTPGCFQGSSLQP